MHESRRTTQAKVGCSLACSAGFLAIDTFITHCNPSKVVTALFDTFPYFLIENETIHTRCAKINLFRASKAFPLAWQALWMPGHFVLEQNGSFWRTALNARVVYSV